MSGTGVISTEDAIAYGITGPFLRATGADYDVRKDCPYAVYDRLPLDVPVGSRGDNMDRYLVRMEEMEQSMRIVERALRDLPRGPVRSTPTGRPMAAAEMVDLPWEHRAIAGDSAVTCQPSRVRPADILHCHRQALSSHPRRILTATSRPMQQSAGHVRHGVWPPGERCSGGRPTASSDYVGERWSRQSISGASPSTLLAIMSALSKILTGDMIADMIPTFGSVNMIGGELDR
jgi:NADH-quinone oxidoreductase subunit D